MVVSGGLVSARSVYLNPTYSENGALTRTPHFLGVTWEIS
jgi:hypothetical protein